MNRRHLITLLGGAAALPLAAHAQQKAMPVVGYLNGAALGDSSDLVAAFRHGLRETNYIEGQNVAIEYRWAEGRYDRLAALAIELVSLPVTVIAATSTPVALAAQAATATIPIVFTIGSDPVKIGLVKSLNRPGGNLTGVTRFNVELGPKRLELLHEIIPGATKFAALLNPNNPSAESLSKDLQAAAGTLGLLIDVLHASAESAFSTVFETLVKRQIHALVIGNDPFFNSRSEQLASLTVRHAVPAIYQYRKFTEAGGLMSYGASNTDSHRQLGAYVGRILAGAQPMNLPVEQSTKVELMINLRTAGELGLTVPQSLLARADEVIE
jgi:putative tryptophan/tyrosine transport system substrate-binding protein